MNFEEEKNKLLAKLREIQYRKKRGKLRAHHVEKFMYIIQILVQYAAKEDGIEGFLIAEHNIKTYISNFSHEYISPHTCICYKQKKFYILREAGGYKKFDDRIHADTYFLFYITCTENCKFGEMIKLLQRIIDLSSFNIEKT